MEINTEALLSCFNEARATALDSSSYNFEKARETISKIYSDWEFEIPKRFIEYESAVDAIKDYDSWKNEVKSVPTNWLYKFPFTLPNGIWTYIYCDPKNYHLAYKRIGAGAKGEIEISAGSDIITKKFLYEIYTFLFKEIPVEEREKLAQKVDEILDFEDVIEDLEYKLLKQDEIGMISADELFILGNIDVMIFDVAICNYLIQYHNIMYYEPYIKYINDMIKYCGLCFMFNDICIICKK